MRMVFLLPVASDVRLHKRISSLQKLGIESNILAFERDYYSGKLFSGGYVSLGRLQNLSYHKRWYPYLKALPVVRKAAKNADAIYAFGLDLLWLGWVATLGLGRPCKFVYEIADLGILSGYNLLGGSLRWLERFLLKRVTLLVVVAEDYITDYYQAFQGIAKSGLNYLVIENKLDATVLPPPTLSSTKQTGILRIGYFGLIRCRRSWEILKTAAIKGNGRIKIYVRGKPMGIKIDEDVQRIPHIEYEGPYVSPDDLPGMYEKIDMS